ncbi:MAG: TolB family protein, partial [Luteitalea sp.]
MRPRQCAAILLLAMVRGWSGPVTLSAQPSQPSSAAHTPTIDDLVALGSLDTPELSPDGRWVAYTESMTDWEQDAFVTQAHVIDTRTGNRVALTRGTSSISDLEWSPDSRWITFLRAVDGKAQIQAIRPDGGEALVLSKHPVAIGNHEWAPDAATIVYTAPEDRSSGDKARTEAYGDFEVVRRDYQYAQLWTLSVARALDAPIAGTQRTRGSERHVQGFQVSPDSRQVAFAATRSPDRVDAESSDLHVLTLAGDEVRALVTQPGPDSAPRWSPDGTQVAFSSAMRQPRFYHANRRVAVVAATGGAPRSVNKGL